MKRLLLVMVIVGTFTQLAMAGLLQPFSFSFASSLLNNVFLLPFRLPGCF